jgi:hypothetical protein
MWEQHQTLVLRIGLGLTKKNQIICGKEQIRSLRHSKCKQPTDFWIVLQCTRNITNDYKVGRLYLKSAFFSCQEDLHITWKCLLQSPSFYGDATATKFHLVPKPRTAAQKAVILYPTTQNSTSEAWDWREEKQLGNDHPVTEAQQMHQTLTKTSNPRIVWIPSGVRCPL